MRLEGHETQSDNGVNDNIINIKTNKINFKKSQSMRKIKVKKDKKIIRTKVKRSSKVRMMAKNTTSGQFNVKRYATNRAPTNTQPVKKSHSLDSMQQMIPSHSIMSPTAYGPQDYANNPAAFYAM